MRRFTTALIALTTLVAACVDHSNDYEVIVGGFDVQDVRTDRPRPDVQDVVDVPEDTEEMDATDAFDAPDVEDVVDTGPLPDGGSNGMCPGGNVAVCPTAAHATVTCESDRCIYRCAAGFEDCDGLAGNGCEGHPIDDTRNCGGCGTVCPAGAAHSMPRCESNTCGIVCAPGFGNCDGDDSNGCEINLQIDPMNCAACGTVCLENPNTTAVCTGGVCSAPCRPGFSDCNPSTGDGCEIASATDMANCGGCGVVCSAGANQTATCAGGVCNRPCNPGFGDCDSSRANGCEASLTDSITSCGACGTVCVSGPNSHAECNSSVCSLVCDLGYADCDGNRANGCEVNLAASPTHCGTCTNVCAGAANATPSCSSATCGITCNPNFANCDTAIGNGCEINISNDRNNCGACGTVCMGATNATSACVSNVCQLVCSPGYTDCNRIYGDGCEIQTSISPLNCGTCGTVCASAPNATPVCNTGVCNIRCNTGYLNCDGDTSNGCEYTIPTSGPSTCP